MRLALVNHTNFIKAMYFSLVVSREEWDFIAIFTMRDSVLSPHVKYKEACLQAVVAMRRD